MNVTAKLRFSMGDNASMGKVLSTFFDLSELKPGSIEEKLWSWHRANLEYACATNLGKHEKAKKLCVLFYFYLFSLSI